MDFSGEIARAGFGYVLFLFSIPALIWAVKGWMNEKDKRTEDVKDIVSASITTTKDLLNANANLQRSVDALTTMVQENR